MPTVILPDGQQRSFPDPVTVYEVACAIGAGLAKAAVAGEVAGRAVDLSSVVPSETAQVPLRILTAKDPEGLEVIRHSAAHLLAQAVKRLYPSAQVTIGPVIENGFYYDFAFERPFTPEDLQSIEAEMALIAKAELPVSVRIFTREAAILFFKNQGEHYKAEIIAGIPAHELLTLYTQGEFTDLCRGPHVPHTGHIRAFKLLKLAGAYWRGDSNNEMLQRIYGTAWPDQKSLEAYLFQIEQAKARDHRKLGQKFDLFHLQEEAPGMIFWHPKGFALYQAIEQYMRNIWRRQGYQEVRTPQLLDRQLWERSGHWDKFLGEMYTTKIDERSAAIKPMNCPGHVQIFNEKLRSYRDLPLRLAEFGCCHRKELSGALHGLMRTRAFVQDDAHIFCTPAHIEQEARDFNNLLFKVYADFGFTEVTLKLSTRPKERVGDDAVWDRAEAVLQSVLEETRRPWILQPGEGAFYGPKIEYAFKDSIGRMWQLGTLQLDFSMPERLGAHYIAEDGSKKHPVMLHRAICGSLERFIGVLIEHYAGDFPVWLAPVQWVVMNITDSQAQYAASVHEKLSGAGFRGEVDLRNEKIGFKIREHSVQRIPYLLIVGDKERLEDAVSVRNRAGEDLGVMRVEAFIDRFLPKM